MIPAPYRDLTPWEGVPAHKIPADIQLAKQMAKQRARAARTRARLSQRIYDLQARVKCRDARIRALEELLEEARQSERMKIDIASERVS